MPRRAVLLRCDRLDPADIASRILNRLASLEVAPLDYAAPDDAEEDRRRIEVTAAELKASFGDDQTEAAEFLLSALNRFDETDGENEGDEGVEQSSREDFVATFLVTRYV